MRNEPISPKKKKTPAPANAIVACIGFIKILLVSTILVSGTAITGSLKIVVLSRLMLECARNRPELILAPQ